MSVKAKIVRNASMRGGSPTIDGTRITVTDVVRNYWLYVPQLASSYTGPPHPEQGFRVGIEAIAQELSVHFQSLSAEQVRAALVYWYQHQEEIQKELDEEDIAAIELRRKYSRPA